MIRIINEENIDSICLQLSELDPRMALIYATLGTPPVWGRQPGFATLAHIILEQQVSIASARAAFNKLITHTGKLTPQRFLEINDIDLKVIGFSRQKALYCRNLAQAMLTGTIDLNDFEKLSDDEIRNELKAIKGIGPWSADIYLLMAMLRPDIMPKGDLALHSAFQELTNLKQRPGSDDFQEISKKWRPFRSVAARLLWHYYLRKR